MEKSNKNKKKNQAQSQSQVIWTACVAIAVAVVALQDASTSKTDRFTPDLIPSSGTFDAEVSETMPKVTSSGTDRAGRAERIQTLQSMTVKRRSPAENHR